MVSTRSVQLLLLLLLLLHLQQHQVTTSRTPFRTQLQPDAKLMWDYSEGDNSIVFELLVPAGTKCFIFGFSPNGELPATDFTEVTSLNTKQAKVREYLIDARGKSWKQVHAVSRLLQVKLIRYRWLSIIWQRPITVHRYPMRYSIDHGTTHLLFQKNSPMSHSTCHGRKIPDHMVQLLRSKMPIPSLSSTDAEVMEVRVESVRVPDAGTTYWCRVMPLPRMSRKMHIIGYEPVITKGSESLVHHLEVFFCVNGVSDSVRDYNAPCNSETKPMGMESCRKVIGAWAMGAEGIFFPEEAGLPIGGGGGDSAGRQYVVIELHYNNEKRRSDLVDSSGLRFFVTPRLRKHDVGILELGLDYLPNNAVPPRQSGFDLTGYCLAECTAATLPPQGIWIFASQLHTHTTGVQVATWHSRIGQFSRRVLNIDPHYSPHFQEIRLLPRPVHVLPGDSLTTSCTYNTKARSNVTFGGIAISNEMCLNYVFYFPKVQLEVCKSVASVAALSRFFSKMKLRFGAGTSEKKSIEQNYASISWGRAEVQALREFFANGRLHESCNSSAGVAFPGHNWENLRPPADSTWGI